MQELNYLSAKQLVEHIKSKQVSVEEVTRAYLQRIDTVNPQINAIVQQVNSEEIIAEARQADAKIARGEKLGKLHGLPITIKDGRKVKGLLGTKGNNSPFNQVATEDATVVARLRAEGAIILGLTNIPELFLAFETDNLLYGKTNNPYDLTRTPGGSSGGEAAIIAAGGSALGIGSDGGGSIRQPAHNVGIAGIKPTQGLVPLTGAVPADGAGFFSYLATQGPMARSVDDLILTLPIIAGPDQCDPHAVPVTLKDPAAVDLKSLRVAFHTTNGFAKPTDDIVNVVMRVAKELLPQVQYVEEACPKGLEKTYQLAFETFFLGGDRGQSLLGALAAMQVEQPSPLLQELLAYAKNCEFSVAELRMRMILLDQFRIQMLNFMENYDVIISPVAATPAKLHGLAHKEAHDFTYTMAYNLTGWPAASVRCGTSKEGLPIGVQVIAKPWRDDVVLAVAKQLEEMFGGWQLPSNLCK